MSEFKFACPVCGQHITADSSTSGGHIECPTCFQKIVVPQAPSSADSKFILSASQVSKPRPGAANGLASADASQRSPASSFPVAAVLLVLVCAAGAAVFFFRDKIFKRVPGKPVAATNAPGKQTVAAAPKIIRPVPTNIVWTLDLTNAVFPETIAAGSIHGSGFLCERTTLEGGTLTLRQGKTWPPDLGVTVYLVAKQGEELSGKTVEIPPDRAPPVPRVTVRWKDDQQQAQRQNLNNGGYALKLVFGDAANMRIPGKIYLCLPDESKSVVAGAFDAEIRRPPPPKKGPPKTPKPKP